MVRVSWLDQRSWYEALSRVEGSDSNGVHSVSSWVPLAHSGMHSVHPVSFCQRNAMLYRATDLIYDVKVVLAENFDK